MRYAFMEGVQPKVAIDCTNSNARRQDPPSFASVQQPTEGNNTRVEREQVSSRESWTLGGAAVDAAAVAADAIRTAAMLSSTMRRMPTTKDTLLNFVQSYGREDYESLA